MVPHTSSLQPAKCFQQFAGVTSENVAAKFGIDRATQDKMAVRSHARAAAATNSGRFRDEIVPVHTVWKDPKTGEEKRTVVDKDDGIREGVGLAQLSKLPPVFKSDGSTTAGNSSQVLSLALPRCSKPHFGEENVCLRRSPKAPCYVTATRAA